jgi:preprotein translocase subunit SecB
MKEKSTFQFLDYVISKSLLLRGTEKSDGEFNINITPSGIIDKDESRFQLTLDLKLTDNTEQTVINIEAIGFFSFEGDYKAVENFLFLNAPAILYPYLRAYISSLTALSGLDTITIPTMNLSGLKDQLKENTKFLDEMIS